jgi:hypothetical protein
MRNELVGLVTRADGSIFDIAPKHHALASTVIVEDTRKTLKISTCPRIPEFGENTRKVGAQRQI